MPDGQGKPPALARRGEVSVPKGAETLDRSGKAADEQFSTDPTGEVMLPCGLRRKTTWIEIQLLDAAGAPVANRAFQLKLPSGEVRSGTTDSDGLAGFDGIDPGSCELTFDEFKFTK